MGSNGLTGGEIQFLARLFNGEVIPANNQTWQVVKRLKEKVAPGVIENRHGEGYILGPNENVQFDPESGQIRMGKEF